MASFTNTRQDGIASHGRPVDINRPLEFRPIDFAPMHSGPGGPGSGAIGYGEDLPDHLKPAPRRDPAEALKPRTPLTDDTDPFTQGLSGDAGSSAPPASVALWPNQELSVSNRDQIPTIILVFFLVLRFLNFLEPGRYVISISKSWMWGLLATVIYILITTPENIAAVIGASTAAAGSMGNYAWRRYMQHKTGQVLPLQPAIVKSTNPKASGKKAAQNGKEPGATHSGGNPSTGTKPAPKRRLPPISIGPIRIG